MKGLSFCDDMLRAFSEGRKSCTRRLMNPQPDYISVAGLPFLETQPYPTQIKPRYLPGEVVYIKGTAYHARITDVRPERIQGITPDDCEREGITGKTLASPVRGLPYEEYENGDGLIYTDPLIAFHALWDTLHPGSWEKNEWVFRYGIERVEV